MARIALVDDSLFGDSHDCEACFYDGLAVPASVAVTVGAGDSDFPMLLCEGHGEEQKLWGGVEVPFQEALDWLRERHSEAAALEVMSEEGAFVRLKGRWRPDGN